MIDVRQLIAEDLERQARRRDGQARDRPEDDRIERSAVTLRAAAAEIREMAPDIPALITLRASFERSGNLFASGDEGDYVIGRWGLTQHGTPLQLIEALAAATEPEAPEPSGSTCDSQALPGHPSHPNAPEHTAQAPGRRGASLRPRRGRSIYDRRVDEQREEPVAILATTNGETIGYQYADGRVERLADRPQCCERPELCTRPECWTMLVDGS